jgi:pilus assembly protein CpaE
MSALLKAHVAVDAAADRELVQAAFPDAESVEVVGLLEGLEAGDPNGHFASPADVLIVACGGHSEETLAFVAASVSERPNCPVVVLSTGAANGFVRRVFEAGAEDIVVIDGSSNGHTPDEVLFTLQKAVARRSGSRVGANATGRVICVVGPKGGIGKTLTTANLAVGLVGEGHSVTVVDLDLQFGDVGLSLGLTPEKTIYDLATAGGSIDEEKVEAYLATHESGVRVLLAPTRPDQAGAVTPDFLRDVYANLRASNDYVVVDTPPGFTPEVIASIDSSTDVCMVGMLDSLSLKNTKLGLEALALMGYDSERIRLVLNRADSNVGITPEDVVAVVGREPDVLVPSHRDITRSVNNGTPVTLSESRSEAARAFRALATLYTAGPAAVKEAGKEKRRSLLRRKGS